MPIASQNHAYLPQGSRLLKNLFGEQVGGSSAGERNPPKHDRLIVAMVSRAFYRTSPWLRPYLHAEVHYSTQAWSPA